MAKFIYTVYLPGLQKTVHLTELSFYSHKQLVKCIINDDDKLIAKAFDQIIEQHCNEDVSKCDIFDKMLILLTIRAVCISPDLEVTVTCPVTKKPFNCNVDISYIKDKISTISLPPQQEKYDNALIVTFDTPSSLFIPRNIETFDEVIRSVAIGDNTTTDVRLLIEKLPAAVLRDANNYIINARKKLSEINLVSFESPYDNIADQVTITANIYDNSPLELLKICFKRNLLSIYELEYFLLKQIHITHSDIQNLTPAEVAIYMNLFNEEQKELEKMQKKDSNI